MGCPILHELSPISKTKGKVFETVWPNNEGSNKPHIDCP